ncbi:MAG TPA: CapA family protein [Candidatus Mediterraneibacter quadrami]|uniref:CapA family protein n=1 Tax=Candidatus Mediterraneibacter quadrami TaxID=2838684 RepID=A0A9D2U727_9FIRM|nr:CapA family protein [Candidatus Mediterraneibacter quadrami]
MSSGGNTGGRSEQERMRRREARLRRLKRRRRIAIGILCAALLLIILVITGIVMLVKHLVGGADSKEAKQAEDLTIEQQEAEKEEPPVSITISAAGDCTLGTDENFDQSRSLNAYYDENGPAYFLQSVKPVFEADDLTIVNMEGTLTESTSRMDKTFAFKGPADYTKILTEGSVEAANLANNHSRDYGEQSYTDTIAALDAAGIVNFGYDRTAVMDVNGVKVGLVGTYELAEGMGCEEEMIANIKAVEDQGAQIVIVSFHWGIERENYPDENQVNLAHSAIDHGADLVLGHHPHVLQGIEVYNGKNIVYSLGNFCFGGNSNPSDKDTMIFQQTFTVQNGELVEDNVTNVIPCSLSSESGRNTYQPTPLEGEEKDRVMAKIEEFSAGL